MEFLGRCWDDFFFGGVGCVVGFFLVEKHLAKKTSGLFATTGHVIFVRVSCEAFFIWTRFGECS